MGALKQETLLLKCAVDASPSPTSFQWTFHPNGEHSEQPTRLNVPDEVSTRRQQPKGYLPTPYTPPQTVTSSFLNYTPSSDLDYGTVSCWARNAIDVQKSPCVFRVVAASRPFPLQNCSVADLSPDSLQVTCEEGFDGGLSQAFLLQVVAVPSLRLVRNLTVLVRVSLEGGRVQW